MMESSKRLLAGVASVFLLVLAGTAGILISDKNQKIFPAVREPIGHRKKEKSWK